MTDHAPTMQPIDAADAAILNSGLIEPPVEREYVPLIPVGASWSIPNRMVMHLSDGSTQEWYAARDDYDDIARAFRNDPDCRVVDEGSVGHRDPDGRDIVEHCWIKVDVAPLPVVSSESDTNQPT